MSDYNLFKNSLATQQEAKNARLRDLETGGKLKKADADAQVAANDAATIALMAELDAVRAGEDKRIQDARDETDQRATERERANYLKATADLKAERDAMAETLHANGLDLQTYTLWQQDDGSELLVMGEDGKGKLLASVLAVHAKEARMKFAAMDR